MTPGEPDRPLIPATFRTARLLLRPWHKADLVPFAAMNADVQVMEHFPSVMSAQESEAFVNDRIQPHFADYGYGLWAVERQDTALFIGFVGLMWQTFPASFTPALEVGWRLSPESWGHGFATEAAAESLRVAFEDVAVPEVVSMTSTRNVRSIAVMRRLGMTTDPADDFDHPRVPEGHPLRRHVLFRISASQWASRQREG